MMPEYQFHDVASIFPMMTGEEFEQLKEDIKEHGLREPIWLHEGKIIDGRNRYNACIEVGRLPKFRVWEGEGSLVEFVMSINLHRRHLNSSQRATIAVDALPILEAEAKERQRKAGEQYHRGSSKESCGDEKVVELIPQPIIETNEPPKARDIAARIANTNSRYVSDAKRLKEEAPDVYEKVQSGALNIPEAKTVAVLPEETRAKVMEKMDNGGIKKAKDAIKIVRREEKAERKSAPEELELQDENCRLIHSDISLLRDHIDESSIDCIITDPPYPKEYLPLYRELAEFAAYALKPGGSCIVMTGQSYLPDILKLMTPYLNYQWTAAYMTPGGQSVQLWGRKVNTFWKPLLWFVNGDYAGDWIGDVCRSEANDNDKRFHHWGQSESGMLDVVTRFTDRGDTILDPFVGGGATAIAALAAGRKFIGADIKEEELATTTTRISTIIETEHA